MIKFIANNIRLVPMIVTVVLALAVVVNAMNCSIGFEGNCINLHNFTQATVDLITLRD
jgi:hypothetical protein